MAVTDEVIRRFATRRVKTTTNTVEWANGRGNVYCRGTALYSYGSHWPLAIYIGRINNVPTFIKNGDRYSVSTAGHLSGTQSACKGPTVSRASVEAAGVNFHQIILAEGEGRTLPEELLADRQGQPLDLAKQWDNNITYVMFWQEDSRTELIWDRDEQKYYTKFDRRYKDTTNEDYSKRDYTVTGYRIKRDSVFKVPPQGMFIKNSRQETERYVEGVWHVLGAVVLECHVQRRENVADKRRKYGYRTVVHPVEVSYLLCSLDEGSYFVAKLPVKPTSVQHAFDSLKPEEVNAAIEAGKEVKRQGEWFFIPYKTDRELAQELGITIKALNEQAGMGVLPLSNDNSNRHVAKLLKVGEKTYAKGRVFHRFPSFARRQEPVEGQEAEPQKDWGTGTGQHRTVHLEEWHEVHRNTELASWSGLTGRVD